MDDFFDGHNNEATQAEALEHKGEKGEEETKAEGGLRKKTTGTNNTAEKRIGVHCVAGLGRAPLLVALALVNKGCSPVNTIDLIRKNRKGALNVIQANFILEYKPKKSAGSTVGCQCVLF